MATVRSPKPAPSAKYDAFVAEQLRKARRRIRLLDVSSALLLFVAGTLVYTLVLGLLDRRWELSAVARQSAFLGYAVAAVVFLAVAVVRPLWRRVNPYFAARAVEGVVPEAKNSLVNWLDLHEEMLPPAISASLSQRAAKDLGKGDQNPEEKAEALIGEAISSRRAVWLTGITALLAFVLFGLLVTSGTGGFGTLLARVFAPFGGGAAAHRTQLTLVRPANGDAVLGVGQSFDVAVRVEGRVPGPDAPDALKLLFRYRDGEPYEEQVLAPENGDVWMTVVPASRTFNGFWYKVKGGDAETPEFRVTVRSTPLVERFDVTYHYRPYTGWPDVRTHDANLKALRGTEAELVIHTNRPVKEGRLELETRDGKPTVPARLIPEDPKAMRARLVMDQDGQYRVWFKTTDDDTNVAAMPYTIQVLTDTPPQPVELTKPAADVTLPANGTLRLAGTSGDNIGVKEVTLRLRQTDGVTLQPKPYRAGKSLQLGERGYPTKIDYTDFVALDQLKDEKGKPFPLSKGMVLEYWLDAADACDYPGPNPRTESKHFKVTITEPPPDKQQPQKDRDQAAEEQKKHDKEEDQKLKEEEKKRQQEAEEKQKEQQAETQKVKGNDKPDSNKGGQEEQTAKQDEKTKEKGNEVSKDLKQQAKDEQNDRNKADAKGPQGDKGEGKGDNQPGESPPSDKCEGKSQGQKGDGKEGDGKGEGKKENGKEPDKGDGKPEGTPHQDATAGDGKGQSKDNSEAPGSARSDGPPKPNKGDGKGQGQGDATRDAAAPKDHGAGPTGEQQEAGAKGAGRDSGEAGDKVAAKGDQPAAQAAPKPSQAPAEAKAGPKDEGKPQAGGAKAEAKSGGQKKEGGEAAAAGAKDDPTKRALGQELKRREEDVRRGTDKQSNDAKAWLEKLARNAEDKKVRDLAKEILDDARKDRATSPALPKGPPPEGAKDGPPCECKGGGQGKDTGSGKTGDKEGATGKPQGQGQVEQGGGRNGGEGRIGPRKNIAEGRQEVVQGLRADEAEPTPPDPAHRRWAGSMQLPDPNSIDKQMLLKTLQDHHMTPEEWQAYQEQARAADPERLPDSQNAGASAGAREVKTPKGGANGDKTGVGEVPPEFRRPFKNYTGRQAEKK